MRSAPPPRRRTACRGSPTTLLLIARADQGPLPIRREVVEAGDLLADVPARFANRARHARPGASGRADATSTSTPIRYARARRS